MKTKISDRFKKFLQSINRRREQDKRDSGLKDEQGQPIYEGDVLQAYFWMRCFKGEIDEAVLGTLDIFIVAIREGQFGILKYQELLSGQLLKFENGKFCKDLKGWLETGKSWATGSKNSYAFRKIGNIHDNPELLDYAKNCKLDYTFHTGRRRYLKKQMENDQRQLTQPASLWPANHERWNNLY